LIRYATIDSQPQIKEELADESLLGEDKAEAHVHYGRLDDSRLVEELGKPMSRIEPAKERADKIIEKRMNS